MDNQTSESTRVPAERELHSNRQDLASVKQQFLGCLLGGAVGDALGAPVEFMRRAEILARFGPGGITEYAPAYGGIGRITDDTQMAMFTAEGLIRAWVRANCRGLSSTSSVVSHAYLRWLQTQGETSACDISFSANEPGWLFQQRGLHSRRAPGNTCLSALREMPSLAHPANNNSKGCGGVMRVAPVGLFAWRQGDFEQETFRLGTELAALTHGHPTGALTGGVLAVLIWTLVDGASLSEAISTAKRVLKDAPRHEETLSAIEQAERLAGTRLLPAKAIAKMGEGWIAEEALAISIYCALVACDFEHGVILAVNHDGDSDSTGAIVGNLLGTMHGASAIPTKWLEPLELREVISELADDLYSVQNWDVGEYSEDAELDRRVRKKYPGF